MDLPEKLTSPEIRPSKETVEGREKGPHNNYESNEIDESSESFIPGWSHAQEAQNLWVSALTADLSRVAAYDPRPVGTNVTPEVVETNFYNAQTKSWSKIKNTHVAPNVPVPAAELSA